jgi:putative transposase
LADVNCLCGTGKMPVLREIFRDCGRSLVSYYKRSLPHWHPAGARLFLTWCLHGCFQQRSAGEAFHERDLDLDMARSGSVWLRNPAVAQCVVDTLQFGQQILRMYELHAYVIMPNHVHAVLLPLVSPAKLTKSVKWYSARRANEVLGRTGQPFWQAETYDRWVRDDGELARIIRYVERNPVRAGLVDRIEDWPWSSAAGATQAAV